MSADQLVDEDQGGLWNTRENMIGGEDVQRTGDWKGRKRRTCDYLWGEVKQEGGGTSSSFKATRAVCELIYLFGRW